MTFKPLLASPVKDANKLKFPVLASPKLDGIRCIIIDGVAMSRSLKPIPNAHVQALFGKPEYEGLDGELICGSPTDDDVYRKTNSAVMSKDGQPDVTFYVFDTISLPLTPFRVRATYLTSGGPVVTLSQTEINDANELLVYEREMVDRGYEGVMIRDPDAHYKFGRSTSNEGILLKLKRFTDDEAVVVGFEEQMHNANEAKKDALGHTERSSHKEGMVPKGTLGALVVERGGQQFNIGTGFSAALRQEIWNNRDSWLGKIVKFKHFEIGAKDLPRFPVYQGLRDPIDM